MIKKLWNDPVWSKVIAAGLIPLIGFLIAYLAGLLPHLMRVFNSSWNFLTSTISVPVWLFFLICIPTILFIITIIIRLIETPIKTNQPYHVYTSDHFYGMKWTWNYNKSNEINDICSFCPKCDFQIVPEQIRSLREGDFCQYVCSHCGNFPGEIAGSFKKINQDIKLRIQRELRTGDWVNKIEKTD